MSEGERDKGVEVGPGTKEERGKGQGEGLLRGTRRSRNAEDWCVFYVASARESHIKVVALVEATYVALIVTQLLLLQGTNIKNKVNS